MFFTTRLLFWGHFGSSLGLRMFKFCSTWALFTDFAYPLHTQYMDSHANIFVIRPHSEHAIQIISLGFVPASIYTCMYKLLFFGLFGWKSELSLKGFKQTITLGRQKIKYRLMIHEPEQGGMAVLRLYVPPHHKSKLQHEASHYIVVSSVLGGHS